MVVALLRRRPPLATSTETRAGWGLLIFALLFMLFMTAPAKKFDRYLMPTFLVLDVVAGLGWTAVAMWAYRTVAAVRGVHGSRWRPALARPSWAWCCSMGCSTCPTTRTISPTITRWREAPRRRSVTCLSVGVKGWRRRATGSISSPRPRRSGWSAGMPWARCPTSSTAMRSAWFPARACRGWTWIMSSPISTRCSVTFRPRTQWTSLRIRHPSSPPRSTDSTWPRFTTCGQSRRSSMPTSPRRRRCPPASSGRR